ncbi:MAG: MtnX-like HAD-IB family phosphatase [Acidobacteriota bacterium]
MKPELTYTVFTDFDATITREDIGDNLFRVFGEYEACVGNYRLFREGRLDARECWRRNCATIGTLTKEELFRYVDGVEADSAFPLFADFCRAKGIPVAVVSDGFDVYIERVLSRIGLSHLPVYSNRLSFAEDGTLVPEFPHTDAECAACANCKRNHLLTHASETEVIVYIGDGHSDCCPARFADVVFAKATLLKYCERENITYHRFETYRDVLGAFRHMVETSAPRKRRTAELARNDIYMQG